MSWALPPPVDSLRPRSAEGWRQGMVLALAAHGLLLVALMFSVQWRTSAPEVVEAEVWSEVPRPAAPSMAPPPAPPPVRAPEPPPPPEPPAPAPPPAPIPAPPPPAPPPPADVPVTRPVERPRPPRSDREVFVPDPPQVKQRLDAARPKPVTPPAPAPRPVPAPPPVAEARPPVKATPPSPAAPSKQDLEKARQDNIRRMLANLSEDRLQSAGPSAEYAGRIKARVKPNIILPADIPGNPVAVVEVRCAPDGRIIGRKLLTASGVPAWDDAVLRAIDRTEILPLDERGRIPTPMLLELRPKDF